MVKPQEPKPDTAATKPPAQAIPVSSQEQLGEKNIEGLIVTGRRFTNTIPIGAQGNDRPLVSTTESWFSSELKVMVLSTSSDPRQGGGSNSSWAVTVHVARTFSLGPDLLKHRPAGVIQNHRRKNSQYERADRGAVHGELQPEARGG